MLYNYEEKIPKLQEEFTKIINLAINDYQNLEIHMAEETIFRELLKLGQGLLNLYISKQGTGKDIYEKKLPYHKTENRNYISIFGDITIPRAYFWKKGSESGEYPLDKKLNLPEKEYSYLLDKWSEMFAVDSSYDKSRKDIETIFGINIWSKQMEEINKDTAIYVDNFYDNKKSEEQKEPILCVQIDGKGVVIKDRAKTHPDRVRLGRGEKNNCKKMATVTAVYGIDRNERKIEDIVKEKIAEKNNETTKESKNAPKPQNKLIRGTLEGKDIAFENLKKEVLKRDPNNKCDQIALVDGEVSLAKKITQFLSGFIIIIDLFHVMERLWTLCYIFHKEKTKEAENWVKKYLTMILSGKVGYFVGAMKQIVTKGNISKTKGKKILNMIKYFEKRKKYMRYDEYLSKGYPIGTGVIEGACRSFVKDRMELAGMRWSELGAEAMLKLRSIKINSYWDEYWNYFTDKKKVDLYQNKEKSA